MVRICVLCGQKRKLFTKLRRIRRHFFLDEGKWVRCPISGLPLVAYMKLRGRFLA